jgi:hypothetical protein
MEAKKQRKRDLKEWEQMSTDENNPYLPSRPQITYTERHRQTPNFHFNFWTGEEDEEGEDGEFPGLHEAIQESLGGQGGVELPESDDVKEARLKRKRENEERVEKEAKKTLEEAKKRYNEQQTGDEMKFIEENKNNVLMFMCPVCQESIATRVYECRHLICFYCSKHDSVCKKCPTCRQESIPLPLFTSRAKMDQ